MARRAALTTATVSSGPTRAFNRSLRAYNPRTMPLTSGARLGPYEIVSALGAGGMGEVYRARDSRLERDVAIKILPSYASGDPEFRARFEREAKTVSQLNHPNICVVYDVGRLRVSDASASRGGRVSDASASRGGRVSDASASHGGPVSDGSAAPGEEIDFIVMELLEGETLAARLQKGALPIEDVLRIGGEIADALDKAHRKGIVHRDLKPANVMLTPSGSKLLDFGLAKPGIVSTSTVETRLAPSADLSQQMSRPADPASPRPTAAPLTARGTILGTFQYMAPEQIEGEPTDARTDIWAFGCVLYEMTTGRKAFEAKSQASLIAGILEKQPAPVAELQPMTPPGLGRIVRTCLAKNPDDRFQTAHDLALQLEWIEEGGSAAGLPAPVVAHRKRRDRLIGAGAALVLAAASAVAAWVAKPAPPVANVVTRFADILPEDQGFSRTGRRVIAVSPDGSKIAYVANQQLFLRKMNEPTALPIPGTNVSPAEPVFSPDGESIVFWSNGLATAGDIGKLWRLSTGGGTPTPLCDSGNPVGMTWSGSVIVFGQEAGILSVADTGGTPEILLAADRENGERLGQPQLAGGGRFLVFVSQARNGEPKIEIKELPSGERRQLVAQGTAPRVLPSGHLVYLRSSTLFAQVFDERDGTVRGSPVSMVQQTRGAGLSLGGQFSVSESGTLAYVPGAAEEGYALALIDRNGRAEPVAAPRRRYYEPRISPDGTRIATSTRDEESPDVFVWDLKRGIETRVTRGQTPDTSPLWLPPDGRELLFATRVNELFDLFRRRADLTDDARALAATKVEELPTSIAPDGRTALVNLTEGGAWRIGRVSLETPGEPELLFGTSTSYRNGTISPDGRWIAYEALEGETYEVFVRPFPNVSDGRFQISQGGGIMPAWSRESKELFYVAGTGAGEARSLASVSIRRTQGSTFDWGEAANLFQIGPYIRSTARGYDVAPGAQRFVVVAGGAASEFGTRGSITVVAHWFDELRARVQ
jgi:serine/threonine protein kinase/Tol biopolymer transport system component